MSESTIPSLSGAKSNSWTNQFNILNVGDYYKTIQEFSQNTKLWDFMQESFHLKHDMTRGLQFDELRELIESDHDSNAQFILKELQKLSKGQSMCLSVSSNSPKAPEITVIFGQMLNNKYDVLNIRVKQTTEIDQQKLKAVAVGAACAGIAVSAIATPVAGVITTGAILTSAGLKTIHDRQKLRPDLLYAYIFKELSDKEILWFEDGHAYI
ncbi:unnamed protein product [Adineta steineri]|uniref:Uncharacterized protein n=1 Tax=Adineta steineri TaxID=433720 RepID=A0A818LIQ0_9BILA|nr:unnamed protein product [Adineta steineri]CAF3570450.1 unnamed protein product [Adineta steineri]